MLALLEQKPVKFLVIYGKHIDLAKFPFFFGKEGLFRKGVVTQKHNAMEIYVKSEYFICRDLV